MEKEQFDKVIGILTTHLEHKGAYCDTGDDMDWACRSECVELAVKRLQEFYDLKHL